MKIVINVNNIVIIFQTVGYILNKVSNNCRDAKIFLFSAGFIEFAKKILR